MTSLDDLEADKYGPVDVDTLPPTQYLILDVLAARHRTGEVLWTFPSHLRRYVRELERLGLVWWKHGVAPKSVQVGLTDAGVAAVILDGFVMPTARIEANALERAARHLDAIAELPVRPDAATYLRERADRLRNGVGWEDERLFGATEGEPA